MISRRSVAPSLSSSRQMMIAWKVSGLSQSPAIMVSRPASMRLAMAISPSRDRSSTEPISRRYMRTGSSVRSVGSFFFRRGNGRARRGGFEFASPSLIALGIVLGFLVFAGLVFLDHIDAHVGEHRGSMAATRSLMLSIHASLVAVHRCPAKCPRTRRTHRSRSRG
jgi:hypothetical protein